MLPLLVAGCFAVLCGGIAQAQSITIQGKVTDADGAAISGSTQFRVQILSPDTNHCVLYDESRTIDLTGAYGLFSINLGASGGTRSAPTTFSLEQVLSNRGSFSVDGTYCLPTQAGPVVYAPAASDNRKLTIQFKTGSSAWETIPEMDLNPVPFAVDARNLGGFPATQVVRVSGGLAPLLTSADVTSLNALLDGSSTKFVSNASGKGAQLPSFSSDPSGAPAGSVWFDSVSNTLKYRDNSGVVALSAAIPGGPITSVSGTGGLTGSGSSGAVSLSMASISGVAGSYGSGTSVPVLTVDGYGRITVAGSTPISGAAPTGSASGDLSGNFPGPTVAKIRGASVSSSAPAPGQFYRFDDKGTPATTDDEWVPVSIRAADLKDGAAGNLFPGACAANQVFHFNGLTGGYDCGAIAGITSAQLATSGTLPAGGTFRSVTVDTKGLVTAGTNPTTIDDYAITDAVKNGGAVPKITSGSDSPSLPATALEGELFVATNSKKIYRYTTGAWLEIASAAGSGSLTDVLAGGGLARSAAGSTVTLSLPSIAAVTNATKVSTDAFGRVISAGTLNASDIPALDWSKITTGRPTTVATSGLTDAITNLNNAKGIAVGTAAPPPRTAATLNTFYINSATGAIYYDDGTNWQSIAAAPGGFTGSLSGDVSGTQSGTTVDKIKGVGVTTTALTTGNFFRYNGSNWVNALLGAADLPNVPINKGGTGLTAAGTADQFLSMKADASGLEYKSITAGTGVTLTPSAGGLQISAAGTGGTVTNVTASAPIVVTNGSSTPSLTIAKATAAIDGYLDKADFANFAGKLDATATFAGDVSGPYGATSVNKLKGKAVTYTSIASGNFLKYNGTDWVNANLTAADITSGTLSAAQMPAFTGDVTSTAGSTALTLGTVPTAKGGTGLTTAGTTNQVLGMNNAATGLEYKTITGGTGVTINHAANGITINATGTGIASLNSLTTPTQTFGIPGVTGLAPGWVSTGGVHTLNIPMASTASVTAGLLSKVDYDAFTAKVGTATAFVGDVTGTYNATSVDKLKGNAVSNAGLATGQFLKFSGSTWSGSSISLADMVNNIGGSALASAACGAGQTMYYDTGTKELKCQAIGSLDASAIASGTIPGARLPASATYWQGSGANINYTAGNVGIGTATPASALHVAGTIRATQICDTAGANCKTVTNGWANNATFATLTDAATVAFNGSLAEVYSLTLGGNRTMGAPTSLVNGKNYTFLIRQDATGGRTITWDSAFKFFGKPALVSLPNALTVANFYSDGTSLYFTGGYNIVVSETPDAFTFAALSNAVDNSLVTSATVTLTGIVQSANVNISGTGSPAYRINGGPWLTTGSVAPAGATIQLQVTSSNVSLGSVAATVTVGGYSTTWTVTTQDALYPFTSHTFTNCGTIGLAGPVLSACQSAYSGASWAANSSYLNMTTQGIQRWTVPKTGNYRLTAKGASGGGGSSLSFAGSPGASMAGIFALTKGSYLTIMVGQMGGANGGAHGNENGGGGGTFVISGASGSTALIVAGGGGGAPATGYGTSCVRNATTGYGTTSTSSVAVDCQGGGNVAGSSGGLGGSSVGSYSGGGGGGLTGNGVDGVAHCAPGVGGRAFTNGGNGGTGNSCYTSDNYGGFGGGGGGGLGSPGSGGGYSGGASITSWSSHNTWGGGGASYNAGTSQANSAGANLGHGSLFVEFVP